ncbi:RagB/SusD family nutrient uptake outer membrane protein, partial [Pedobacter sp.]|uniref:RagB/SusD family nutrient uptake outer membrane protein n=1 Tax=Pedobacter sp. TaxID=1411316 RepID=UPI002C47000C
MNRLVYISILVTGILISNTGCKKFLAEKSQDLIKPTTVQDLTALMAGEAYPYQTQLQLLLNMVTDDVTCYGGQGQDTYQSVVITGRPAFTWSKNMYQELLQPGGLSTTTYLDSWQILYKCIAGCNVTLAYADQVTGSDADKQNLKGQALALRAYYYFILVNLYGKPFNSPGVDPANSPGVPLKLTMEVTDEFFKRNSIAEVYTQIEADLKNAASILMNYPESKGVYKMSETAAYTLLSRVYLYEEKWDLAVDYATKGLAKKSVLTQLSSFGSANYNIYNVNTITSNLDRIYDPSTSNEIIWAYVPQSGSTAEGQFFKSSMIPNYNAVYNPPYAVSPDLLNLYDSKGQDANDTYIGDLRPRLYFNCTSIILSFTPPDIVVRTYKFY